jgi:multisubunit Na+/H+ antiporter MnhG subunit
VSAAQLAGWACAGTGVALVVVAAACAVLVPGALAPLHLLTVVTSLGVPLAGIGVAVLEGGGLAGGMTLLTVAIVAVTGPAIGGAIGRLVVQDEGRAREDAPR